MFFHSSDLLKNHQIGPYNSMRLNNIVLVKVNLPIVVESIPPNIFLIIYPPFIFFFDFLDLYIYKYIKTLINYYVHKSYIFPPKAK